MVYNAMYPVRPQSFVLKNNRDEVKKREEEASQSSNAQKDDKQIQQENKSSAQKYNQKYAQNNQNLSDNQFTNKQYAQNPQGQKQPPAAPTAQVASPAEIKRNPIINIAQILKDFRSTAAAIGTPNEINEEVNAYLSLTENQVKKPNPNIKLVKSNLKNASALLDNYITETLQRPSQVVENWLDALFLQQINFEYDAEEINKQFLVKFPTDSKKEEESIESDSTSQNEPYTSKPAEAKSSVPQDDELKSLFVSAKKFVYAKDDKKGIELFQQALKRAQEVSDKETESKILYEIGKIYDKNDYLAQALTSYHQSLSTTSDTNIKTKAHYSMAQIYDDVAEFKPAIEHYMSSISYAGESENLGAQSKSLTKIGCIFTDKYNKEAFDYYSEAKLLAKETNNSKVKGYVSNSIADAYTKFNEPQNALKEYSEAVKEYQDAESPQKVAANYMSAAQVMKSYSNHTKAKSLLAKALISAQKAGDSNLISKINQELSLI